MRLHARTATACRPTGPCASIRTASIFAAHADGTECGCRARFQLVKTAIVYAGAVAAEIAGCFAFWGWLRLGKPALEIPDYGGEPESYMTVEQRTARRLQALIRAVAADEYLYVAYWAGNIIITTYPQNHRKVEEFLQSLIKYSYVFTGENNLTLCTSESRL